ncbi:hypothetical protein JQS43_05545 [Natronosporangium hydrolyticum]|uniref:(2Fe-2S) ferredoxin domain-containing protein n=1 Tax=Natronosporangium hydrolyticum TaxID=2811111 RepID=A0A895YIC5_9ACTN|nr:(2Fe-2S) ferredoxin domain-containing protein [Natronosporangium hydrolyticum]QSB15802.1 hypothetical protein JQS43_05545 [Natronosporangium hydrolyticum]
MNSRHILLVARQVAQSGGQETVRQLATAVAAELGRRGDDSPVGACFLDGEAPSLVTALDQATDAGASEIVLVPTHLPPDRYLDVWLRRTHGHWVQTRGDQCASGLPTVAVTAPLALQPELVSTILAALADPVTAIGGVPGPFRSPAWSTIPRHRHHVLVCRGPRCAAYGAAAAADALSERIAAAGLADDTLVTSTGCLFPCNLGPLVVVHPEDVWYTAVDEELAGRIIDEHLAQGRVVADSRATTRLTTGR